MLCNQTENIICVFVISRWGYAALRVFVCMFVQCLLLPCSGLLVGCSICDEEVSSWLGPHGAVQAAARWSIIYYRTSLLLFYVTNALHRDGLPEVNAARLTPVPSDKYCQCLIQKSSSSAEYHVSPPRRCLLWCLKIHIEFKCFVKFLIQNSYLGVSFTYLKDPKNSDVLSCVAKKWAQRPWLCYNCAFYFSLNLNTEGMMFKHGVG